MFLNLSDIVIKSSFGSYQVKFGSIEGTNFKNSFFLIDQNLKTEFELATEQAIYLLAKEADKTLSVVEEVMIELSSQGMTKNHELVVIGGGFLQDIGTIVASLYMRGIDWTYVPTTLAAMGDSCIGGKSSINAGNTKNLVGNYYPPREVFIDSVFVTTLPEREIVAGISEMMKICYAKSFETFTECTELLNRWQLDGSQSAITQAIQISLVSKQFFVEEDEFDLGVRKLLNFGHSFGHALESASGYKIPHGVAVLLGMIAASQHPLSETSEETASLVSSIIHYCKMVREEIINEIVDIDFLRFSQSLAKDKKNSASNLVLILPHAGGLRIVEHPFSQNSLQIATDAMKSSLELVLNEIR